MYNIAFLRNISNLQKIIGILGNDLDNSESKELLTVALREFRLWNRMYLEKKVELSEKPIETKEQIYAKVIKTMRNAKIPSKHIVRFKEEWNKHRWNHIKKGVE